MDPDSRFAAVLWTAAVMATADNKAACNRKVNLNSTAHAPNSASILETSNDINEQSDQELIATRCARTLEKNEAFMKSAACEQLEKSCPFELETGDRKQFIDGLRRISFIGRSKL